MNRLAKCIQFQLKSMAISTLVYTAIYYGACILLFTIVSISIDTSDGNNSISSGFYIGSAIFAMIYVISNYRSNFNYLMIFGNSRKNIFFSFAVTALVMSAALSLISVLTQWFEGVVLPTPAFGASISLLKLVYGNTNIASEFLYYSALFILICSFAMLYSSLAYKLGKVFITVFWVVFGLSFIILPMSAGLSTPFASFILNALIAFFRIGTSNGVLLAPVNFIIASVLFAAITYLLSRRQPQTA